MEKPHTKQKRLRTGERVKRFGSFSAVVLVAMSARAATFNWDGGGGADTRWTNAANWDAAGVPGVGSVDLNYVGTATVAASATVSGGDFATGKDFTLTIVGSQFQVDNNAYLNTRSSRSTTRVNLTNGATWYQNGGNIDASDYQGASFGTTWIFIDGTSALKRNVATDQNAELKSANTGRLRITLETGSQIDFGSVYLRSANASQVAVLQGAGTVTLARSDTTDHFRNNGRVEASGGELNIGFPNQRWGASSDSYGDVMNDGTVRGYYASGGGKLTLPGIDLGGPKGNGNTTVNWADRHDHSTIPMINSLQFTAPGGSGQFAISILATDHADVAPGLIGPIGVWTMSAVTPVSGVTALKLHYDNYRAAALDIDEANLKLMQNAEGYWTILQSTVDTGGNCITASNLTFSSSTQFAVALDHRTEVKGITIYVR